MKTKLLLAVFLFISLFGYTQTAIPDVNFETYLETHSSNGTYQYTGTVVPIGDPNSMGDGVIDGFVPTSKINAITELDISSVGTIADLTGIEDFAALESLICEANQLTSLNVSQNTVLTTLFCNANQLTSLNVQNGNNSNFTSFMATNNPNLTCIQVDDIAYSNANWGATFNKDITASYSMSCSGISGIVSYDCTTLLPQQNVQIKATATNSGNIYYTTTNVNGEYSFSINETGTITTEVVAPNLTSSPVNYANNYTGQAISNQDFCVDSATTGNDVHVTIIPITRAPRPGEPSTYSICFGNYGSTTVSGTVNYTLDGTKVSGPTSPDSFTQSGDTLSWTYSNLAPFEIRCIEVTLTVNPATGTNAVVSGDYLIHTVTIDPISGDIFPTDNTYEIEETVVNAYDPNDMTIFEGPYIQPSQSSDYLNFRIRFQNTGTASAINIDVKTILDAFIDVSTFQPVGGSHAYSTSIINTNEVTFSFVNINLDYESNNEPASHGWITFKAKPIAVFAIGDIISAQADIFFDTNAAIITNTATVQIAPPTLTYVPDNNFEHYLETHNINNATVAFGSINSMGNGINDNYVPTIKIETKNTLPVDGLGILDLTGIEDFTALTQLWCFDNQLTSLDVSQNNNLFELLCYRNQLTSLNINQQTALTTLICSENQLTSLDVATNTALTKLRCENNLLTSLNVKNGNNSNFTQFYATNNPNLTCIEVDDTAYSTANWTNIDSASSFNTNCANPETYVPDNNFENYLETHNASGNSVVVGDPTSMGNGIANDDYVTTANINTVTNLLVVNKNIADLTGIEDFSALILLACNDNLLTSLDITTNTALISLSCYNNNLTSLDISNNTTLTFLFCSSNPLTSLDVTQNTALTNLICSNNQLTSLDITQNNALIELICEHNQLTSLNTYNNTDLTLLVSSNNPLTSLDITQNIALTVLDCHSNQLTNLDVTQNTALTILYCQNNQLINLDVTQNVVLNSLVYSFNNLTSIDVTQNTALIHLICINNQLTSLDVTQNTALTNLRCQNNQLTSLNVKNGNNINFSYFSATNNPNLTCIEVDDTAWSTTNWSAFKDATASFSENCALFGLTYVPDDNFENYLETHNASGGTVVVGDSTSMGNGIAYDDYVTTSKINTVTNLLVVNKNIADLTGIEDFLALQSLLCSYNQLTALNISANTNLITLVCNYNSLTSLDVSSNLALTKLWCISNSITSLNISTNANLLDLECYRNQLTSLDVSSNTALTKLWCNENQLTSLNTSSNVALTNLQCYGNQITSLDVSSNTLLTNLFCSTNQLTNLNVRSNTALIQLICDQNQLTSLDVSFNPVLTYLGCSQNLLTSLNVKNGNNTNFSYFNATNNPNLTCIEVDDTAWSTTNWTNIDAVASFSTNCTTLGLTYVPDDNFEQALITLGYDTGILDDYVPTANISGVTYLNIVNLGISDLTGIEDFLALEELQAGNNQITTADFSTNIALEYLYISGNQLTNIDVSQNLNLIEFVCGNNQLTQIDITQNIVLQDFGCNNNSISTINTTQNSLLKFLTIYNNVLTNLDVSLNTALVVLYAENNLLTSLNVKNGNNSNFAQFNATNNPNLTCIEVDDAVYSTTNWTNIDASASFRINCSDYDNDGVFNNIDLCPNTPNGEIVDANGCAQSQLDDDNDGVFNNVDLCPNTLNGETVDANGCSDSQLDDDNDGVFNNTDLCPNTPTGATVNASGCAQSQLDDDNDGVFNDTDACQNTPAGATVDATGCASFILPLDNFSIVLRSETCPDKNNGELVISASKNHNYVTTINGVAYEFESELVVANLTPAIYNFCITITGEIYEQCFVVEILKGTTVSGKSSISYNKASIEIKEGTAPFNIYVNGKETFTTTSSFFDIDVKHGDLIEVKTAVSCEGVYSKKVELLNEIIAYPNPSKGHFNISLPVLQKEVVIELYNIQSQLISIKTYPVLYGTVQLNLENQPTGVYIVKIQLDKPVTLKLINQ